MVCPVCRVLYDFAMEFKDTDGVGAVKCPTCEEIIEMKDVTISGFHDWYNKKFKELDPHAAEECF